MEVFGKMPEYLLLIAMIISIICGTIKCIKISGMDGVREEAYRLFLAAEHVYWEKGSGKQKMMYVVKEIRKKLPPWMRFFINEKTAERIIQSWFDSVKDLLDDGKVNKSFRY